MKKAVVAGVIGSAIVIVFVQPILALAWRLVLSNLTVFSDFTYRHAALGLNEESAFTLSLFSYGALVGLFSGFCVAAFSTTGSSTVPDSRSWAGRSFRAILHVLTSKLATTVFWIAILTLTTLSLSVRFRDMQLNASFRQRLAVLAPRISDQEHKEFVASWASMQTEDDYEAIVSRMEALARANGIRLPKPISAAEFAMWP